MMEVRVAVRKKASFLVSVCSPGYPPRIAIGRPSGYVRFIADAQVEHYEGFA
jgi:hypothetical protein